MIERLSKHKQRLLFILAIETMIPYVLYALTQKQEFLILAGLVTVNNALIAYFCFKIFGEYDKNSVRVEEILGLETKSALLFGQLGIVTYDENHDITWQSDFFNEIDMELVGKNIRKWQPILEENFNSNVVTTISYENYQFEVYNHVSKGVLYLKDVTNFNELLEDYHRQQVVYGYLSVDNFDETIASVDEQKGALIQSKVRYALVEWAKQFHIIIRRYRQENYAFVCNEESYALLAKDKFSILSKIREISDEFNVVLGLSIGISRHEADLTLLDDQANDAYSLALSRGGDQVVVKAKGEGITYFGGNSETRSKASKVKSRVITQSLLSLFKEAKSIYIMGHKESDLDSLGASIGLYYLASTVEVPTYVVVNPESMEAKTKRAYRKLSKDPRFSDIFVLPNKAIESFHQESLLVMVDNHRYTLAIDEALAHQASNVVVIDHHRRGEEFVDRPTLTYLEPSASSTVELITELYDYCEQTIHLEKEVASTMYAGLLVDTNNFRTRVGARTFKVAAMLKDMNADMNEAYGLLQDDFVSTIRKAQLVQNTIRLNQGVLISIGEEKQLYDRAMLAKVGNDILEINEIEAAFVVGRISVQTVAISARSTGNYNVQIVMEKMGGGGHFSMAACQINDLTIADVLSLLQEKINEYDKERNDNK